MLDRRVLSRRSALIAAGGALVATACGMAGRPGLVLAAAPMLGAVRPSVYRFKLGAFEVTTILDGQLEIEGPYPNFGANQPADAVKSYAAAHNVPWGKYENSYTPTLVNTGRELVLFDAGNGAGRRANGAGNLRALLPAAGYSADQIDVVVITHGHPDHISGLIEDGKPAFPKARYVFGATEFDYWRNGESIPDARKANRELFVNVAVPLAEKAVFLKDQGEVVSGIRAIETFGHSPGHMAYHIESEGKRLLLWADTTNHYVLSLQRPDWEVRVDHDKGMAVAARKRILDMAATDRIPAIGYHMPFPAVGFVERDGEGYRWSPASYQLRL
jgi:glyoxylase-like metal-dependent hydrolase (beta-lactamase superfamily II)